MTQFRIKPLVAVLGGAALAISASSAIAGIANTKHNLGSTNVSQSVWNFTSATAEICVFCHTPHAASGDTTGAGDPFAPLWNKGLSNAGNNTYTTYSSNTLDAAFATDGRGQGSTKPVGSVSLACLSCHDGTQAMDNMINAPGFGGYAAAGARYSSGTWSGPRVYTSGGSTAMLSNGTGTLAMLGTNLADDHPIGIAYCASNAAWTATPTCGDKDFNLPSTALFGATSTRRWWIDTSYTQTVSVQNYNDSGANVNVTIGGTAGTRERTDIMLYNRTISGALTVATVECASCHDPHVESKGGNNQVAFLRVTQTGSGVCLACHVK